MDIDPFEVKERIILQSAEAQLRQNLANEESAREEFRSGFRIEAIIGVILLAIWIAVALAAILGVL